MKDGHTTFRIGPIRPPSEALSLLLQITNGCTWNKCKFCQLYRHTRFKVYSIDSIKADIDTMAFYADLASEFRGPSGNWDIDGLNDLIFSGRFNADERQCFYTVANWLVNGGKSVFLQDGNSTALSVAKLKEVLLYLRETFPQIERITSYGRAENLSRVSAEEFAELKDAGLDRIHSGFESGSAAVLKKINKGSTPQQQITAGRNVKAGGIELSVYFMPGVGGKELSAENAEGTAEVISAIAPDFLRIRTAAIKQGTELYEDFVSGSFTLCSDDEKLMEIRRVIELSKGTDTFLASDHIINLLQTLNGSLDTDNAAMLDMIDRYFAMSEEDRRMYQLARRSGAVIRPEDMRALPARDIRQYRIVAKADIPQEDWNFKMNDMICRYI